jgi:hypothetical protein
MGMKKLPFEAGDDDRRPICEECAGNSIDMLDAYGLPHVDLRPFATPELKGRIDRLLEKAPADLMQFEHEGIAFGRLAAHDLALARKMFNFENLPESFRAAWRDYLASALMAYYLVDAVCCRYPVRQMVHFSFYGLLAAGRLAAEKRGIPCSNVTLQFDHRRYVILPTILPSYLPKLAAAWPAWRELSLAPTQIQEAGEDLLWHLGSQGRFVYSPPKSFRSDDVRTRLGLAPDRKLLVAYTSSLDELVSSILCREVVGDPVPASSQPFANQIEWLQALIAHVEPRTDVQLVVRVHPREAANLRESVTSQNLSSLRRVLDRRFQNCKIIWPQDPLSSYDLGESADLVLVSTSSIGLEFARMGVPVLGATVDPSLSPFPSDDFHEWAETCDAYFRKLNTLLGRPASFETVLRAFRWFHLYFLASTLDLGDVVHGRQALTLPPYRRPKEASTIRDIIINRRDILEIQHERLRRAQSTGQTTGEREALCRSLRRILHFLLTGVDDQNDRPLTVLRRDKSGVGPPRLPTSCRVLVTDNHVVEYWSDGRCFKRYSPLAARLARLCGEPVLAHDGVSIQQEA